MSLFICLNRFCIKYRRRGDCKSILRLKWWRIGVGFCWTHFLLSMTILSVVAGLILGFSLRGLNLNSETVRLVKFLGEIFMQVLKLMILPLIFSSLISALAQMDARDSGQIGILTVGYYATTMILATITGIVLVLVIHPGNPAIYKLDLAYNAVEHTPLSPLDTFLDVIRNMFPENVVQAAFQRVQTKYELKKTPKIKLGENVQPSQKTGAAAANVLPAGSHIRKRTEKVMGMNILGIIVFCIGFGIVISKLGEKARIIVDFFVILETVIMRLVEALMWCAPIGIVSLIAGNLLELDDLSDAATVLFVYVITVLAGLTIHTFITMPLLYFFITRRNPIRIARGMLQALVTAFGTASGGAALPVSINCMEEKLKIDKRIARFVLPLGSTINMDGNALYEAVAVIFIAQLNNVTLTIAEVITISFIATIASLGLNSVPAGLVSILVILTTVGLPTKDVSLIITADWLIDRVRTSVNVLGDAFAAAIVAHALGKKLHPTTFKRSFSAIDFDFKRKSFVSDYHHRFSIGTFIFGNASIKPKIKNSDSGSAVDHFPSYPPALHNKTLRRHSEVIERSLDERQKLFTWKEQAILDRLQSKIVLNKVQHI